MKTKVARPSDIRCGDVIFWEEDTGMECVKVEDVFMENSVNYVINDYYELNPYQDVGIVRVK